jgi:hypothetical protein
MAQWPAVAADLHQVYGIDVDDEVLLGARSWPWLRSRITQLLALPPTFTPDGRVVQATRVGQLLMPTPPPDRHQPASGPSSRRR